MAQELAAQAAQAMQTTGFHEVSASHDYTDVDVTIKRIEPAIVYQRDGEGNLIRNEAGRCLPAHDENGRTITSKTQSQITFEAEGKLCSERVFNNAFSGGVAPFIDKGEVLPATLTYYDNEAGYRQIVRVDYAMRDLNREAVDTFTSVLKANAVLR